MIKKLEDLAGVTILWSLGFLCIVLLVGTVILGGVILRDELARTKCVCEEGRRPHGY